MGSICFQIDFLNLYGGKRMSEFQFAFFFKMVFIFMIFFIVPKVPISFVSFPVFPHEPARFICFLFKFKTNNKTKNGRKEMQFPNFQTVRLGSFFQEEKMSKLFFSLFKEIKRLRLPLEWI